MKEKLLKLDKEKLADAFFKIFVVGSDIVRGNIEILTENIEKRSQQY